jgi:hypothetical protein
MLTRSNQHDYLYNIFGDECCYVDSSTIATDNIVKGSRAIITPLGRVGSVAIASKAASLNPSTINRRLNSPNYPDWCFANEELIHT